MDKKYKKTDRFSLRAPFALFLLLFCCFSYSQTLRVGTTLWPGYEPLYLAKNIKAYKHDIRMIHFTSTSEVLRAFKHHTLEAAALTLDEVIVLTQSNIPIEIILILDISEGADAIVGHPKLKNMQGLVGAKIAVESTAVGAYTLSRALEIHNIDINKVILMDSDISDQKKRYIDNSVDAVVTYEPIRTQLINEGAIELFNSKEIPGEILDVLVVHKETLQTHHNQLHDIVQGWFKALNKLNDNPEESYDFIASRMKISKDKVKSSYLGLTLPSLNENKILLSGESALLKTTLNSLAQHMINSRLIEKNTVNKVTLNPSFLP